MSSLEDLLNSSDSDDEFDSQNIDLESLLRGKDGDSDGDDDFHFSSAVPMPKLQQSQMDTITLTPSALNDTTKSLSSDKSNQKLDYLKVNASWNLKTVLQDQTGNDNSQFLATLDEATTFNSLEMADQREQRFLKIGNRDVISALQAKRNSSILSSYSNIRIEDMATISNQLKRNSNYKQHGPGAASALLVNSRFIAVGTTRGLVIVFDHGQEIRQVIGSSVQLPNRSASPVTALDVAQPACTLMICGHATGEIALWDILKGTVLKRINDLHLCRVIKVAFTRNIGDGIVHPGTGGLAMTSELVAVSADCKGVMHKTSFVKALWTAFTAESLCLLDGTSGYLCDVSLLPPFNEAPQQSIVTAEKTSSLSPGAAQSIKLFSGFLKAQPTAQFLAFSFSTQTCVVQVAPFVKIVHKWAAPPSVSSKSAVQGEGVACLDWGWYCNGQMDADRQHDAVPLLARCWGEAVELLRVDISGSDALEASGFRVGGSAASGKDLSSRYLFSVSSASRFENEQFVAVKWLSATRLVALSLTGVFVLGHDLTLVEKSPLLQSVGSAFQTLLSGRSGPDDACFMNLTCVSGKLMHILAAENLHKLQLQSCFDLAHQLIHNGQWLEALALILENVSKTPSLLNRNAADIDKCIIRYVELAVRQPAISSATAHVASSSQSRNHYHLVAGVCIEYCVAVQRMELLYSDLFDIFTAAQQQGVFLESLEPYIMSRAITQLPPNIISEFFETSVRMHRLPSIERCVTHFDIHSVDLDFVTRFLFEHKMFSSFLYAFANGLGDFTGAFQIVFSFMVHPGAHSVGVDGEESLSPEGLRDGGYPSPDQADIGYKLLLFLLYTFQDKIFPRGDTHYFPREVSMSLLVLLTDKALRPTPSTFSAPRPVNAQPSPHSNEQFPYLTCLSRVDPEAVLHCLSRGLEVVQRTPSASSVETDSESAELSAVYYSIFSFCVLSETDPALCNYRMTAMFIERSLDLLTSCTCPLDVHLLEAVVSHCASQPNRTELESQMGQLAEKQSRFSKSCATLKQLLCDHNFWNASLFVKRSPLTGQAGTGSFDKALRYYIAAATGAQFVGEKGAVFQFIEHQFANFAHQNIGPESSDLKNSFCREVVRLVNDLYAIDAASCFRVVCSHLTGFVGELIAGSKQDPNVQFQILHSMVTQLEKEESAASLKDCFSPRHIVYYFKLMSAQEPSDAFPFLRRHIDLCPVEECLTVCRDNKISDAESFLLERSGDVSSALSVLKRDLSDRIKMAKREIDAQLRVDLAVSAAANKSRGTTSAKEVHDRSLVSQILSKQGDARVEATARLPVYKSLSVIVNCAADLCVAHSSASEPGMWFAIFDHLLEERQRIRSGVLSSSGEIVIVLIGLMLQALMSKMKGMVTPQSIIRRVTTSTSGAGVRLGEFKDVVGNMLRENAYELFLNENATSLVRTDLVQLQSRKISSMRRACVHEEQSISDSPIADGLGSPAGSTKQSERRRTQIRGGNKKRFKKFAEFSGQADSLVATAVPPSLGSFSGDFETRRPGSLQTRAVYTAQLNL